MYCSGETNFTQQRDFSWAARMVVINVDKAESEVVENVGWAPVGGGSEQERKSGKGQCLSQIEAFRPPEVTNCPLLITTHSLF